jgi:hypothetical protein
MLHHSTIQISSFRFWGFLGVCLYAYDCSMFLQDSCLLLAPLLWRRQFQVHKLSSSRTHYVEDPCHECDGSVLFVMSCLLLLRSGDNLPEVIDLIHVVTTSTLGFKDLSFHELSVDLFTVHNETCSMSQLDHNPNKI